MRLAASQAEIPLLKNFSKKAVVFLLIISTSLLGMPAAGLAAPIGTDALLELDQRGQLLSQIQIELARDDVKAEFIERGVSPDEVDARIAALSTEELHMLSTQLDELPAGGSLLAVVGVVFVVLLILDATGVTNVFTKI
jgi:hypothetical protein